jgi:hypothetical protein
MAQNSAPARISTIDAHCGAVIARWAIRYSAGRATGVYEEAIALCHMLAAHLTADERDLIVEEARSALGIVQAIHAKGDRLLVNSDEPRRWQELIDELTGLDGDGDDEPVDVGVGRTLALCAVNAMRHVSGYAMSADQFDAEIVTEVARAIAAAAAQFSPSDRVLLMRDLRERDVEMFRADRSNGIAPAWGGLYLTVAAMELDEDYARLNHLPPSLLGPSHNH